MNIYVISAMGELTLTALPNTNTHINGMSRRGDESQRLVTEHSDAG